MKLILCSESVSREPYVFSLTNIRVYTIEEALWHIFNYLNQSVEAVEDDAFLQWLKDKLGFGQEAEILSDTCDKLEKKLPAFLRCFDYLNEKEIAQIEERLIELADRGSFEKQKEKGDKFYLSGKYQKAVDAYAAALRLEPDREEIIKNNIGLCCMKCGDYENAADLFEQAYEISKNPVILLNLAESRIFCGRLEKAGELLDIYKGRDMFEFLYLKGLFALKKGEYNKSIEFFKAAYKIKNDKNIVIKISDIYIKQRKYDEAVKFIEEYNLKEAAIFKRLAELYCGRENYTAAVKIVQKGLIYFMNDVGLWVMLARCYRLNLDFAKADGAICKALSINGEDEEANLERARISKGEGRMTAYQADIDKCLEIVKNKYLEENEIFENQ